MPLISKEQKNEIKKRRREFNENTNIILQQNYPKIQNGKKVGTRETVENRKAVATRVEGDVTGKTNVGLTAEDLTEKEIVGQKGKYNELNINNISTKNGKTVIKSRNNKIKIRNISKTASEGALIRNNWIIYVKQIQLHQKNFNIPIKKFPELVSNKVLQAFYHIKYYNNDPNVDGKIFLAIAPYIFAFLTDPTKSNIMIELEALLKNSTTNIFDRKFGTVPRRMNQISQLYNLYISEKDDITNKFFYLSNGNKFGWNKFENYENNIKNDPEYLIDGINILNDNSEDINRIIQEQSNMVVKSTQIRQQRVIQPENRPAPDDELNDLPFAEEDYNFAPEIVDNIIENLYNDNNNLAEFDNLQFNDINLDNLASENIGELEDLNVGNINE